LANLLWFAMPDIAFADPAVIAYHDARLEPLSARLTSELASEGYQTRLELLPFEPGCESYADGQASPVQGIEGVAIQLGRVSGSQDAACAAIAFATPSGTRQGRVTSSTNDVASFAIQIAEAINGLRARALAHAPQGEPPDTGVAPDPTPSSLTERFPVALGVAGTSLLDAAHPQPLFGVSVFAVLPLNLHWQVQFDTVWMLTPLSFEERDAELLARLMWTRLGIAFRLLPHPAELHIAAGAGSAVTWATARVAPPDTARADVATSAIFSVGGTLAYPSDSRVHVYGALRGSTLVPAIRLDLPSGPTSPFGQLPGEAAIGVRTSW
jgi:hypothetical protein